MFKNISRKQITEKSAACYDKISTQGANTEIKTHYILKILCRFTDIHSCVYLLTYLFFHFDWRTQLCYLLHSFASISSVFPQNVFLWVWPANNCWPVVGSPWRDGNDNIYANFNWTYGARDERYKYNRRIHLNAKIYRLLYEEKLSQGNLLWWPRMNNGNMIYYRGEIENIWRQRINY